MTQPISITTNVTIEINKDHQLYSYCGRITRASGALWNATLRRALCSVKIFGKSVRKMSADERQLWDELMTAIPVLRNEPWFFIGPSMFWDAAFTNAYLSAIECEEYLSPFLPRGSARNIVKECTGAVKNYMDALESYKKNRKKSAGKPSPPKEAGNGGCRSVTIPHDAFSFALWKKRNGESAGYVGLPLPKLKRRFDIGGISDADFRGNPSQICVIPKGEKFFITIAFTQIIQQPSAELLPEEERIPEREWNGSLPNARRVCAIDTGAANIAAITNNIGEPCVLFTGEILSSEMERLMREIKQLHKSSMVKPHVVAVDRAKAANLLNSGEVPQILDRAAMNIVEWCVRVNIGTIFAGATTARKICTRIDTRSNAALCASAHNILSSLLLGKIRCKADSAGIQFIALDESFTSLASFHDGDVIPAANCDASEVHFSGKRVKRDIYRAADGTQIHADLNASANIARKAYPDAFAGEHTPPDFDNIIVITDPFEQGL